jgi:hypothetical protein
MTTKERVHLGLAAAVVLVAVFFFLSYGRKKANQEPPADTVPGAPWPTLPGLYWGQDEPFSGYGGNSSVLMPLFGFVGYSTYATI